jgi:predicted small lipoprotein YifL
MQKSEFSSWFKMLALAALLAVLAACGGKDDLKKGTTEVAQVPQQYDLTLLADKDGQFELTGATLNAEDLRGHIRYRNEAGQPVHTILLKRGEKQKVTNAHVAVLASVARDLKVQAFVEDNDGRLKLIQIAD